MLSPLTLDQILSGSAKSRSSRTNPEIFKLDRPQVLPAQDVRNFPFKPYAKRLILPPDAEVILFGDLHGSVHSLIRDLEKLRELGFIDNSSKLCDRILTYFSLEIISTEVSMVLRSSIPFHD